MVKPFGGESILARNARHGGYFGLLANVLERWVQDCQGRTGGTGPPDTAQAQATLKMCAMQGVCTQVLVLAASIACMSAPDVAWALYERAVRGKAS